MKIAIIGTGGVGGYFGGKLARAGNNVVFLARGEHLTAINENGLTVKSIGGDFVIENAKATDRISNMGQADLIILGVKAWQLKDIAGELQSIIHPETTILPLQNGVLAAEELMEKLPAKNIIGGLCRIISKIEAPGIINHFGLEPSIIFGELDNRRSARVENINGLFTEAGISNKIADDIQSELWKKFIGICVSGLLAVSRATYGEVRSIPETRRLMTALLQEIYTLSQAMDIAIEPDYVDKTLGFIDSFPYDSTTSLSRDVLEGKPSEIEYQNGTVVRLGEKSGVPTPVNRFIYSCILPMEKRARS